MRQVAITIMGILLAVPACQPAAPEPINDADRVAIQAMTDAWMEAHRARDWNRLATMYTEDAILLPPMASAITGRQAIRDWFEAHEQDTNVEVAIVQIEGFADLVYVRGTSTVTIGVSTGSPVTLTGKYLDIRRRQADGSWLVSLDMFSPDVAVD